MMEYVDTFVQIITSYLQEFGIILGMLLIILESIIPVLPLGVFIAFNMVAFGSFLGFVISWISTCIGCLLSYWIFSKIFSKFLIKKASKKEKLDKIIKSMKDTDFSRLVLIVALPFTPAFLVNIACGIVKVNFKKFLFSVLIGKIAIVYFWGFVGKSLLQSITDIKVVIIVIILLLISYILSRIVSKKFKIE